MFTALGNFPGLFYEGNRKLRGLRIAPSKLFSRLKKTTDCTENPARPKAATKTEETSFLADVLQEDAEDAEKKLDRQTLRPLRPPVKKYLLGTTNLIVSNTDVLEIGER